jgi:23S rRNA (uridine2552-2'-O)-methyltransferase|tara:strand:+ start:1138 stop:1749 length:612 start_codon:yes stop_codon:yes gene_type:complete
LKKNKISKNWLSKQRRDIYVRKSKLEGYRSRAIYKLKEIDDKFKIIKNGIKVVDLGSAPGSWSQYLAEKSKNSKIVSIDLKKVDKIDKVHHLIGDFLDEKNQILISNFFHDKLDLVVSDMAVNTTGNKNLDAISTGELTLNAMNFSIKYLKKNGSFLSKIFMGSTFNEIVKNAKKNFNEVKIYKPPSSRKDSKESFIICKKVR